MNDLIKVEDLPELDISEYLNSPEAIAAYFNDILAEGNPALLAAALGDIARAHSMTELARKSGMSRESLFNALRPDSSPRFETITKVCHALGLRLQMVPIQEEDSEAASVHQQEGTTGGALAGALPPISNGAVDGASSGALAGTDYGPTGESVGKALSIQRGAAGQLAGGVFGVWHYGMPRSVDDIQNEDDTRSSSAGSQSLNKPLSHG